MHTCSECDKTYARAEHLRRHFCSVHQAGREASTSSRKHCCEYPGCGRAFTRSDALLRHRRGHERHSSEKNISKVDEQYGRAQSDLISPTSTSSMMMMSPPPLKRAARGDLNTSWPTRTESNVSPEEELQHRASQAYVSIHPQQNVESSILSNGTDQMGPWQTANNFRQQEVQQQSSQNLYSNLSIHPIPGLTLTSGDNFFTNETNTAGSITDQYFSALDWVFDGTTESSHTDTPGRLGTFPDGWQQTQANEEEMESSQLASYNNDDIFGGSNTTMDTTETLNLLNLANAALFVPQLDSKGTQTPDRVQAAVQRDDDGNAQESSWPQEFRPMRKKPPTIELSAFNLDYNVAEPKGSNLAHPSTTLILLEDMEEEDDKPSRWLVNGETRQSLLNYLTHSCRHPWSIYSFNPGPSPSFLNSSQLQKLVELYFARFHPHVPILHAATFDPATVPPILLLSVITIGLVFYPAEMGNHGRASPPTALSQLRRCTSILSVAFSELVRIGVMSAYEVDQRRFADISINQAWILQQMFGIGSGDKRLLKIAERNRGGIVTATRRLGLLFQSRESSPIERNVSNNQNEDDHVDHQKEWRVFIAKESRLRLGWFIYLHDQLFSCYLDIPPMMRHTEVNASMPCHTDLWNAENAKLWQQKRKRIRLSNAFASRKNLLSPLRQLLQPSDSPLQLNHLEAYILAVTLYSIRWDACKQRILFDGDDGQIGKTFSLDGAASRAMKRLADVASIPSKKHGFHSFVAPLAMDVQLLQLVADLHFVGPPIFFDKLRDAAGRSGISSNRRQEAIEWLHDWIGSSLDSQMMMRQMLLASAQIFVLVQASLNSTSKGAELTGMQSSVCTIGLFNSALCMWVYVQFARKKNHQTSLQGHDEFSQDGNIDLPRLSISSLSAACRSGTLNIIRGTESTRRLEGSNSQLDSDEMVDTAVLEAWIRGRYVSLQDEKVHDWPLPPTAVYVEGIGTLNDQDAKLPTANSNHGSHVLECFAKLLSRLDWGLAFSFRQILMHMARHATL